MLDPTMRDAKRFTMCGSARTPISFRSVFVENARCNFMRLYSVLTDLPMASAKLVKPVRFSARREFKQWYIVMTASLLGSINIRYLPYAFLSFFDSFLRMPACSRSIAFENGMYLAAEETQQTR